MAPSPHPVVGEGQTLRDQAPRTAGPRACPSVPPTWGVTGVLGDARARAPERGQRAATTAAARRARRRRPSSTTPQRATATAPRSAARSRSPDRAGPSDTSAGWVRPGRLATVQGVARGDVRYPGAVHDDRDRRGTGRGVDRPGRPVAVLQRGRRRPGSTYRCRRRRRGSARARAGGCRTRRRRPRCDRDGWGAGSPTARGPGPGPRPAPGWRPRRRGPARARWPAGRWSARAVAATTARARPPRRLTVRRGVSRSCRLRTCRWFASASSPVTGDQRRA